MAAMASQPRFFPPPLAGNAPMPFYAGYMMGYAGYQHLPQYLPFYNNHPSQLPGLDTAMQSVMQSVYPTAAIGFPPLPVYMPQHVPAYSQSSQASQQGERHEVTSVPDTASPFSQNGADLWSEGPSAYGQQVAGAATWSSSRSSRSGARWARSADAFRTRRNRAFDLQEVRGHVVDVSQDQHGSRCLQQLLDSATPQQVAEVVTEVQPHVYNLSRDVFGNYVVQKLLEKGSENEQELLASALRGTYCELTLHMYGCRVVQKVLDVCQPPDRSTILQELQSQVLKCACDQHGNHVLQKCLDDVNECTRAGLVGSCVGATHRLSKHQYGCRVVQRILEKCTSGRYRRRLIETIVSNTPALARDQFGNYVVQHVLRHGTDSEQAAVADQLIPEVVSLSQHKFGSNVVERSLQDSSASVRQLLLDTMLGKPEPPCDGERTRPAEEQRLHDTVSTLLKDQYGNYVVHALLGACSESQRETLMQQLRAHLAFVSHMPYGRRVSARVEKLLAAGARMQAQTSDTAGTRDTLL